MSHCGSLGQKSMVELQGRFSKKLSHIEKHPEAHIIVSSGNRRIRNCMRGLDRKLRVPFTTFRIGPLYFLCG